VKQWAQVSYCDKCDMVAVRIASMAAVTNPNVVPWCLFAPKAQSRYLELGGCL